MSKFLIFSDHAIFSKRKASIHFIAESLDRFGHEVKFVTTSFSLTSIIKGDHRRSIFRRDGSVRIEGNTTSIIPLRLIHFQNWHNALLNFIFEKSFYNWEMERFGSVLKRLMPVGYAPDVIIMESGIGLAYYKYIKCVYPSAKVIYLVMDNPKTIRTHPVTLAADREISAREAVVIVSEGMQEDYPNATLIEHGIDIDALSQPFLSPYPLDGRRKVVCVGSMLYAERTVHGAAELLPECDFIIIGPTPRKAPRNVLYVGELEFIDTLKYLRHADVGLAPYKQTSGVSYISKSSLKIVQYMLLDLPIVCPHFAVRDGVAGFFGYHPSGSSDMAGAIKRAIECGPVKRVIDVESWDSVTSKLISLLRTAP